MPLDLNRTDAAEILEKAVKDKDFMNFVDHFSHGCLPEVETKHMIWITMAMMVGITKSLPAIDPEELFKNPMFLQGFLVAMINSFSPLPLPVYLETKNLLWCRQIFDQASKAAVE